MSLQFVFASEYNFSMTDDQTAIDYERDEVIINELTSGLQFQQISTKNYNDQELVSFLASKIEPLFKDQTIIVTLTGGPGSGKTTLMGQLIERIREDHHPADFIITDDFSLYDRKKRNEILRETKDPLKVKEFNLLNKIVNDVKFGRESIAPVYDDLTGDAVEVGPDNFPHKIAAGLHFFFVEGDFQPVKAVDFKIYYHVPTNVRRENRIRRDLQTRGWNNSEEVIKSFNERLELQYYPYTIKTASDASVLITTEATKNESNTDQPVIYQYSVYEKVN